MHINENVYGAQSSWYDIEYLRGCKGANFTSNAASLSNSRLAAGATNSKTPHDNLIDRTISYCALGEISNWNNILYMRSASDSITDTADITEVFPAVINWNNETNPNRYYKLDTSNNWKTYTTNNVNDRVTPIVSLNLKKILFQIRIQAMNNNYSNIDVTLYDYITSYTVSYPRIVYIYMCPYMDYSSNDTPSRMVIQSNNNKMAFGFAMNREINLDNTNIKINYAYTLNSTGYAVPLWGCPYGTYISYSDYIPLYGCTKDDYHVVSGDRFVWRNYTDFDNFAEFCKQQAACFGVFFTAEKNVNIATVALNATGVYMGLLSDSGIGNGDYTEGADNENNPAWLWTDTTQSPYDYTKPIDPTHYNKTTVFGSNGLINTFIQYWALSPAALTGLCDKIYDYIDGLDPDTVDINQSIAKTFYTNNPLDVIVSLKRLPFDITQYSSITGTAQPVKLGNLSLFDITGYKLNGQYTVVDFGSYYVFPKFDNTFLDYAPYTYFELIIPFCGSTRIDPALFMDKTLKLKMVVDLYTGACTCYILADNLCIDSVSGNCAIDIPVSGIQSADFQNSVQNAITNVKNARINSKAFNMRGSLAMGMIWRGNTHANMGTDKFAAVGNAIANIGSSLSSALNIGSNITSVQQQEAQNAIDVNQAEYNLQHVQTPFNSVGSQSAANSYVEEMQARLIIYRPKFAEGFDAAKYAKTIGHACLINGKVSDFSGLTVGNINTDGIVLNGMSPTDTEKTMLKSLFAGGVIL